MKTLLLLMLMALLPSALASAGPARTGPPALGELARDRLQGMDTILLSSDQVFVAWPGLTGPPLSGRQAKAVAARLADLVLDDALYVEDAQDDQKGNSETFTVGKWGQTVSVSIRRDKPYLTIMRFDGNRRVTANYLPVLSKVIRLLQAADPDDHSLSAFHPLPSPVAPAKGIPALALTRIATIKPRMTRADVLHVFTTEGGLSSIFRSHYVYQDYGLSSVRRQDGLVTVNGELIKVNIDFAPRDADIVWFRGRGFWLHQSEYYNHSAPLHIDMRPDDIILGVSPPYLGYFIAD